MNNNLDIRKTKDIKDMGKDGNTANNVRYKTSDQLIKEYRQKDKEQKRTDREQNLSNRKARLEQKRNQLLKDKKQSLDIQKTKSEIRQLKRETGIVGTVGRGIARAKQEKSSLQKLLKTGKPSRQLQSRQPQVSKTRIKGDNYIIIGNQLYKKVAKGTVRLPKSFTKKKKKEESFL